MDWSTKGLWLATPEEAIGRSLHDGAFTWPAMVVRASAVAANIATMARYCARHGLEHAPHGKTTMAPSLFQAQLDAGAWGITVATGNQARVAHGYGVANLLLANEVLDPAVLRWAAAEVAPHGAFMSYVDSPEGAAVVREALAGTDHTLSVLIEIGYDGGRTGCRSVDDAYEVAVAVADIPGASVAGVAGFEGMLPDPIAAAEFLRTLVIAGDAVAPLCPQTPIVSAGGSAYFDIVAEVLGAAARDRGWRVIARSGSYVTHDHGLYHDSTALARVPDEGAFVPALEVWAQVLSTPEPDLALVGAGKRDVPIDAGLPVPLTVRDRAGATRPLTGAVIDATNDQHAYLRGAEVSPGDLVMLGISHPCTAFDKWRVIPVLDDDDQVIDLLHTYF